MFLIIKKVFFLVGLTLYVINANCQIVISTRNGVWTDPTTWLGGAVPTSVNATQIIIDHEVELPPVSVSVFHLVVNNKLTLKTASTLNILADALTDVSDLQIFGTLQCEDGSVLNGTSLLNTSFESGAVYVHQQGPLGFIPYATWDANSTFEIAGFKESGYINAMHGDSWMQEFGNVVYDCPGQTVFLVEFNGYLRNIQGNFIIRNSNNQSIALIRNQSPVISIGGNLVVEGPSRIRFNEEGLSPVINIQGDLQYRSSSAGLSYLTSSGSVSINVLGDFEMDSPGTLRMTSSPAVADGRLATLSLNGDLRILNGRIVVPPLGNGKIVFNGTGTQTVFTTSTGSSFDGNLDYVIEADATVSLGNSALSNISGSLQVKGRLQVGSSHPSGAVQLSNAGNIQIAGQRSFEVGSSLEYNGSSPQWIGNGHPSDLGVNLVCSNPTELSLLQNVVVGGSFYGMNGVFNSTSFDLSIRGDMVLEGLSTFRSEMVRFVGDQNQEVSAAGRSLKNITLNKSGNSSVMLSSPLDVEGVVLIETQSTDLITNGYLTLLSTSDGATGNACIGKLPVGSSVLGDVTVQRFMSGEGRIYRYISSPVQNATVASLMDDFSITGTFADPSGNSRVPSFYFYDESWGGLQAGWRPYPTAGLASANPLEVGRGYAAYIRKGGGETVWDVTGTLNQGEIDLPVAFTPNNAASNGWNLVGNPYASTIDWDEPVGWTKQNISPVISIRDNGVGGGGTFQYWDGDISYSDIPNGQIASGQSMWIRATGINPVLTIREDAKVTNGAVFYRAGSSNIPSFSLVLQRDGLTDRAYFKIRPMANSGLDEWDAIKQENDNFDIATYSEENISLAINAREELPCNTSVIPIEIRDLKSGEYKIGLVTKFDFDNYNYTWIDHYLQTETKLTNGFELDIHVMADEKSSVKDRFAIRLEEILPLDSLMVIAPSTVCMDQRTVVVVQTAQAGIQYSIWDENGYQLSEEEIGTGTDLRIELGSDSLLAGQNVVRIKARSACHQIELVPKIIITKEAIPMFSVKSGQGCSGSTVTLSTESEQNDLMFYWFEAEDDQDTLASGTSFETPVLLKPSTYYVSAKSPEGCSSERFAILADIITVDSARIAWKDSNTLLSNYNSNNSWLHDGQILPGEDGQLLKIFFPGTYTLQVDTLGCITSDYVEFLVTVLESQDNSNWVVYPNPVKDQMYIRGPFVDKIDVKIRNTLGMILWKTQDIDLEREQGINVEFLSPGIYFLEASLEGSRTMIRFVKK